MTTSPTYKWLAALLLFVAFFGQTFRNSILVADYYLNTAKYMRNCTYGERSVTMHCYGKCSVVKKIKEEQAREDQSPLRKLDNSNEVLYFEQFACNIPVAAMVQAMPGQRLPQEATREISTDHFHPPPTA